MTSLMDIVFTYRQIMELVLQYNGRRRPILSLPYWVGMLQGWVLEKLPENILTLTRDQVSLPFHPGSQHQFKSVQLHLGAMIAKVKQIKLIHLGKTTQIRQHSIPHSTSQFSVIHLPPDRFPIFPPFLFAS